jgi:hypothetical protein
VAMWARLETEADQQILNHFSKLANPPAY